MIISKIRGGLGNQMFQYAFAKACSLKYKQKIFFDLSWYIKSDRKFLLNEYSIKLDLYSKNRFIAKTIKYILKPKINKDNGYYEDKNLEINKNTLLEGNWESIKYFKEIKEIIKKDFILKNPSKKFLEISNKINKNSISVHVRRGDYLIPHGKYLNGIEYYNKAVEYIINKKKMTNPEIIIFSDDNEWCKNELKTLAGQKTKVFEEKMNSDVEDMMIMSCFGNNVISNSTYSWWSAFLNKNDDKIVTMPRNWFTDKDFNDKYFSSIVIPEWVVIE